MPLYLALLQPAVSGIKDHAHSGNALRVATHIIYFPHCEGKGVKKPGLSVGCCSNLLLTFRNNDLLLCCFLQIILITSQQ